MTDSELTIGINAAQAKRIMKALKDGKEIGIRVREGLAGGALPFTFNKKDMVKRDRALKYKKGMVIKFSSDKLTGAGIDITGGGPFLSALKSIAATVLPIIVPPVIDLVKSKIEGKGETGGQLSALDVAKAASTAALTPILGPFALLVPAIEGAIFGNGPMDISGAKDIIENITSITKAIQDRAAGVLPSQDQVKQLATQDPSTLTRDELVMLGMLPEGQLSKAQVDKIVGGRRNPDSVQRIGKRRKPAPPPPPPTKENLQKAHLFASQDVAKLTREELDILGILDPASLTKEQINRLVETNIFEFFGNGATTKQVGETIATLGISQLLGPLAPIVPFVQKLIFGEPEESEVGEAEAKKVLTQVNTLVKSIADTTAEAIKGNKPSALIFDQNGKPIPPVSQTGGNPPATTNTPPELLDIEFLNSFGGCALRECGKDMVLSVVLPDDITGGANGIQGKAGDNQLIDGIGMLVDMLEDPSEEDVLDLMGRLMESMGEKSLTNFVTRMADSKGGALFPPSGPSKQVGMAIKPPGGFPLVIGDGEFTANSDPLVIKGAAIKPPGGFPLVIGDGEFTANSDPLVIKGTAIKPPGGFPLVIGDGEFTANSDPLVIKGRGLSKRMERIRQQRKNLN